MNVVVTRSLVVALVCVALLEAGGCAPTAIAPPAETTCAASAPCPGDGVCDDGVCVARCTPDSCATGRCSPTSGLCIECETNGDCGADRVCNTFTNLCTTPTSGCTSDAQCDAPTRCDTVRAACVECLVDNDCGSGACDTLKGACVECLDASDCAPGSVCEPLTRTCAAEQGCADDGDCDGQVCEPTTRVCVECFVPAHCASGQCDTVTNTCVAGCVDDDANEPGEGADALAIAAGAEHDGSICPDDIDEFVFDAEGAIEATLLSDGDALTLTLQNDAGLVLDTGPTRVVAADVAAGTYRIVVRGAAADATADYQLQLTVTPPVVCEELDPEPNNTPALATTLPVDGSLRSGRVCGDDIDFWGLDAGAGDTVTVTLVAGDGAGAASFDVQNAQGQVLQSGDAAAPLVVDSAPAGGLLVRVSSAGGDAGYSLRATTSAAPPACVQSDPEPNDLPEQAPPMASGDTKNGQICAGDVDQWRFNAGELDDAQLTITGTGVRTRVFDDTGAVVGEGTATFSIVDLAAGPYRIEVKGQLSTTEAAYGIGLTLTPEPVDDVCAEGGLEPDAFDAPRALVADGVAVSGRICDNDDVDFFRFTVTEAGSYAVSARFTDDDGDLDLRLKTAAGDTIDTSLGVTDEELILTDLAPGSYVAEIFGFSGAVNTYTLSATQVTCTDDDFEQNDTALSAVPVSGRAITAVRCPVDDDFWAIRIESGDTLDARLTGTGVTLSLVSSTGTFLQGDTSDGADRRLQASSLTPGRYALRVTGTGTQQVNYTLTPSITPNPARCVDDGAEPNNGTTDPFVLDSSGLADGSYALSTLTMCEGALNTDTFAVDLPGERKVRFALQHALTADLDIEVLEQRGTSGLYRTLGDAISLEGTLDEVNGVMNVGGRVIVRVSEFGTLPAAGVPYTLGFELSTPPAAACIDDRFDTWTGTDDGNVVRFRNDDDVDADNDVTTDIAPVPLSPPEALPSLRICPDNADFFSVNLTAGQRVVAKVTYPHSFGRDIDLRVFGPDDSNSPADPDALPDPLLCSSCDGISGTETFDKAAPKAGLYFIEVFGFQADDNNGYKLEVTTP